MATRGLVTRGLTCTRVEIVALRQKPRPMVSLLTTQSALPTRARGFSHQPQLRASLVANPATVAEAYHPRDAIPPEVPDSHNPEQDSVRHAAFLGEADSNDGHDAQREAYGQPPPSLDARNSAYLGEADSNDGFEVHRDAEGRDYDPLDASHSAYLGEADSDDGFEGRRAAHPEEGDHGIEDASGSGIHGQSGEGDTFIEEQK